MKIKKALKTVSLIFSLTLFLSACSQEAQPYEETNDTVSKMQEQGSIQTH